jgi:hypothetical protein
MLLSLATYLSASACLLVFGAAWWCRRRRVSGRSLRAPEPSGAFYAWVLGIVLTGFALLVASAHS